MNKELDAQYDVRPLPVVALLDAGDILNAKLYVSELATLANRYIINDITAYMAINHIRKELHDRNLIEAMQPEWGMAERKVNAVHREQQHRIQSAFWGEKHQNPYK
jgi:hypothetical protein